MKVLVTGSTGYLGSAICETLKSAGHAVAAMTRRQEKTASLHALGYQSVVADIEDADALRAAARQADAVIHAALHWDSRTGERDHAATETILSALEGSGKPFIYTSGVWVMGDTRGRMLGEISVLRTPPLLAWRPPVEELVLAARERGIQPMVFRPGMVFGRKGGFLAGMFKEARERGAVYLIGAGDYHWSCVHVSDLAALYALALAEPAAGELFIATGGMPQPVKKIALAVAKACGVDGRVESLPLDEARRQMGPMADCLAMDNKVGSTKAARFFGWTVKHPSVFDEIFSGSYLE